MILFRAMEVGLKLYKVAIYARYLIFDADPLINQYNFFFFLEID